MRTLGLALVAMLLVGCTERLPSAAEPPPQPARPDPAVSTPAPSRLSLEDLPVGPQPRIGYLDHQVWVTPDGRRTRLPLRYGVSAIVPYAGGFLAADNRYFEGSVGLWMVRSGQARELPGCSAGSPRLVDGWVWWITSGCPESADTRRTWIHRARPDGSCLRVRALPRRYDGDALFQAARVLDRLAPQTGRVRERPQDRLVVVYRRGLTAVVRVDARGDRELATPPVRLDARRPQYVLGPGR